MKKSSIIRLTVFGAYLCFQSAAFAQSVDGDRVASIDNSKLSFDSPVASNADATAMMAIRARNTKMYDNFSRSFKNASEIRINTEADGTRISCKTGDILNKVLYTHSGRWTYTVRYYDYTKIPQSMADQVSEAYPRYNIFGFVSEVNVPGKTAYLVMVENKTSWKRLRITDDEIEVYEEYQKP